MRRICLSVTAALAISIGACASPRDGDARPGGAPAAAAPSLVARDDSLARMHLDSANRARPGYIIDSILPIEEELRRFRATLAQSPRALSGGASDRGTLASRFIAALARDDSTALAAMRLSRAEFAYLVYPESPYTRAPFRSGPGLVWRQIAAASDKGLIRLRRRLGGRPLELRGLTCDRAVEVEGRNRLWAGCRVRIAAGSRPPLDARLFGTIIARDGRFKFVSYANEM